MLRAAARRLPSAVWAQGSRAFTRNAIRAGEALLYFLKCFDTHVMSIWAFGRTAFTHTCYPSMYFVLTSGGAGPPLQ
eukprot:3196-Eustigmatos_ZCMA.PRE.1